MGPAPPTAAPPQPVTQTGYAINNNGVFYTFSSDCTNFVSQALRAGGHKFYGTPSGLVLNNNSQWWQSNGAAGRTYSWSVADSFGTLINTYDNGAGTQYYQPHGSQGNYVPSGIAKGDPVLYILDYRVSPARYDHASIVVGTGTDPVKGWVGTLVDEHSTNRYHAIWNLIPYNSKWAYTVTAEWHMLTTA